MIYIGLDMVDGASRAIGHRQNTGHYVRVHSMGGDGQHLYVGCSECEYPDSLVDDGVRLEELVEAIRVFADAGL